MNKRITAVLLGLFLLLGPNGFAQLNNDCAKSRIKAASRTALATTNQQKLMNKYDVHFYKLDVALERTSTYIQGNGLIRATTTALLDTFAFELHQNLAIDSLFINGVKRTFARQNDMVFVKLPVAITFGNAVSALIFYKGTPPTPGAAAIGEGMTSAVSPSWGNRVTWSLSEPFSALEWFPVKQVLADKADSSEVWVTTSATNKAGSNGVLMRTVTLPNLKKRYEWKCRYPIDYYLISVAVSDYVDYTIFTTPAGSPNAIPIQNYVYSNPGALTQYQSEINTTGPLINKFSELFGLYPFYKEKYGHCMAPLSGGMEHQTMTTLGYFEFTLIAHELAHQWFGDNVTCKSWRDIWLNEGFARYCEHLALEKLRPGQQVSWLTAVHNSALSQPGGSVYIPAVDSTNVNRIFSSRLTYDKGASTLHMLRFEMKSDTLFFMTMKRYQQLHKAGTTKTPDFKNVAETVSGLNLTTFFNQWIYGEGYPTLNANWNQVGRNFILRSTETVSRPTITSFFETDLEYKLITTVGDTLIRVRLQQPTQYFTVRVRGTVTNIEIDPNQWVLHQQGTIVHDPNLISGISQNLNAKPELMVFPNPVNDLLHINNLPDNLETVQIYDATGKCVRTEKERNMAQGLDVSKLTSGLYVLKINAKDRHVSATFQKQ